MSGNGGLIHICPLRTRRRRLFGSRNIVQTPACQFVFKQSVWWWWWGKRDWNGGKIHRVSFFAALRFQAGGILTLLRLIVSADAISQTCFTDPLWAWNQKMLFLLSSHVHVNIHRTVGQKTSDVHVEPGYLQPSGGTIFVWSLAVWLFFLSLSFI